MATDKSFAQLVADTMAGAGNISYRKMFGEYGVYCDGVLVALVCDNRLFIKPTAAGRAYIGEVTEAPAYPGARPSLLIEDRIDDREWLSGLVRATLPELGKAREKKPKRRS